MKRLHILSIAAALLLGGCDADNILEDTGTTAQELTVDTSLTNKVVGGTRVGSEETYPWMTAIFTNYNKGLGYSDVFCGGSLIADRWVLTAAHCVMDLDGIIVNTDRLFVSVGTIDLDSDNVEYIGVADIIVHPDYDKISWPTAGDIALIQLESAPGNETISIPRWKSTPVAGETITIAGWGATSADATRAESELREADMLVRSEDLCHPWYEFDRHVAGNVLGTMDHSELVCAGGTVKNPTSGCWVDSGSPVFVTRQNGEIVQAGITKGGWDCGDGGIPGLYTKVAKYQSWINSYITPTSMYKGGSDEVSVQPEEAQADWVRLDANDSLTDNMDFGAVGRYRLAETQTVTLTSNTGDVDLLVYDSWRMDPEDIVCTSDNGFDEDEDEYEVPGDKIDTCELDSRGTYYARVIAWEDSNFTLENE